MVDPLDEGPEGVVERLFRHSEGSVSASIQWAQMRRASAVHGRGAWGVVVTCGVWCALV